MKHTQTDIPKPRQAVVESIEGGRMITAPADLEPEYRVLFQRLCDEVEMLRGSLMPSDEGAIRAAVLAQREHDRLRVDQQAARDDDALAAAVALGKAAQAEMRASRAAITSLGIGGRDNGTRRRKDAAARIGPSRPEGSRWRDKGIA